MDEIIIEKLLQTALHYCTIIEFMDKWIEGRNKYSSIRQPTYNNYKNNNNFNSRYRKHFQSSVSYFQKIFSTKDYCFDNKLISNVEY
jgi:hypothetical protein